MSEYDDSHMLSKTLERIAAQAKHLKEKIDLGLEIPSWAEYKVYSAYDGIGKALGTAYPGSYGESKLAADPAAIALRGALAGTVGGGVTGAATDEENRLRGALLGSGVGSLTGAGLGALSGKMLKDQSSYIAKNMKLLRNGKVRVPAGSVDDYRIIDSLKYPVSAAGGALTGAGGVYLANQDRSKTASLYSQNRWRSKSDVLPLEKQATVSSSEKQYRRALQLLSENKSLFHGVGGTNLKPILESGEIRPGPRGYHSYPGVDEVYFGRHRPTSAWGAGGHLILPEKRVLEKMPDEVPAALRDSSPSLQETMGSPRVIEGAPWSSGLFDTRARGYAEDWVATPAAQELHPKDVLWTKGDRKSLDPAEEAAVRTRRLRVTENEPMMRAMRTLHPLKKQAAATATKTDPQKWEQAKAEARAKMGGKHSARAMQLATKIYKDKGGGYSGAKPSASNNSLKKWTKQDWNWTGGDKPGEGGRGVYLPKQKADRLRQTEEGKDRLAKAARQKREATRQGEQYSSHGLASGTSLRKGS